MKWSRVVGTAIVGCLLWTGTALADYQPNNDINVSVQVLPGVVKTNGGTGRATFGAQEQAHGLLTSSTGQSVDHFYVWVYVNGQPVAAVDPFCMYSTR